MTDNSILVSPSVTPTFAKLLILYFQLCINGMLSLYPSLLQPPPIPSLPFLLPFPFIHSPSIPFPPSSPSSSLHSPIPSPPLPPSSLTSLTYLRTVAPMCVSMPTS